MTHIASLGGKVPLPWELKPLSSERAAGFWKLFGARSSGCPGVETSGGLQRGKARIHFPLDAATNAIQRK
jgi:hypothetical protein